MHGELLGLASVVSLVHSVHKSLVAWSVGGTHKVRNVGLQRLSLSPPFNLVMLARVSLFLLK